MEHIFVTITAPDAGIAHKIALTLVKERLAACASIVPEIRSVYRWQGKIEDQEEALITAKTRAELFSALEQRVKQIHPYDEPEIVACSISDGSRTYLEWVTENTTGETG